MNTNTNLLLSGRRNSRWAIALLAGSLSLALLPMTAQAQINRVRSPQYAPPVVSMPPSPGYGRMPSPTYDVRPFNPGIQRSAPPPYYYRTAPQMGTTPATGLVPRNYGTIIPRSPGVPGNYGNIQRSRSVPGAPPIINPGANFNRFQHSQEGLNYHYHHGIHGHDHYTVYFGWAGYYFPGGYAFYPYYSPSFLYGVTVLSPYGAFYGAFPPFIGSDSVYQTPPPYSYVPQPAYGDDGSYQGWRPDDLDNYYLNRQNNQEGYRVSENSAPSDPLLKTAVDDIKKAWDDRDIQLLSKYLRRDSRIAVYLRGNYQYSLDASDYLDMTRDAFNSIQTVHFDLNPPKYKEKDVYMVTGRHVYRDKDNIEHTVYVSYVLQKIDSEYVITQVGTAPEQIR